MRPLARVLVFSAALMLPTAAFAQVDLAIEAKKRVAVRDAQGRTSVKLEEPKQVLPGDEIAYAVRLTNRGAKAADALRFVTPIPRELAYRAGSAQGGDVEVAFSADGGRTFAPAGRVLVADGSGQQRPASPSEYTHIQWRLPTPLPAAAVRTVTYHASVR